LLLTNRGKLFWFWLHHVTFCGFKPPPYFTIKLQLLINILSNAEFVLPLS